MPYIFYYKITCLLVGLVIIYLGYNLFIKGIFNESGDIEGSFKDYKLILKKAAPGTYFIVLGTIIIALTIFKGLSLDETLGQSTPHDLQTRIHIDTLPKLKDSINLK